MSVRTLLRLLPWLAIAALPSCSTLVGADFDVSLRPSDAGIADIPSNGRDVGGETDAFPIDTSNRDVDGDGRDASIDSGNLDGASSDGRALDSGDDGRPADGGALDVGSDIGPRPPTGVRGSFVFLGPASPQASKIDLQGHIISNAYVRGTTASGITIEGRLQ